MKNLIVTSLVLLFMISCNHSEKKETLLLADREAPIGWVYLRIYTDNTFEFEYRGLERIGDIYSGTFDLKNDTINFKYSDSIPKAGNKAVITKRFVSYFNGVYPESLEIKKNEFK